MRALHTFYVKKLLPVALAVLLASCGRISNPPFKSATGDLAAFLVNSVTNRAESNNEFAPHPDGLHASISIQIYHLIPSSSRPMSCQGSTQFMRVPRLPFSVEAVISLDDLVNTKA
jgi:hypothetical protein